MREKVPKSNALTEGGKRKRKATDNEVAKSKPAKKMKTSENKEKDGNTSVNSSTPQSPTKEDNKRKVVFFNDQNVDVNLHHEAPQNIKYKKIQMSQSLIVLCQTIDGNDMKGNFNNDFAAITFQKK